MMSQISIIFSIAVFREKAQNLVASNQLMFACLIAAIIVGFVNRELSTQTDASLTMAIAESVSYSGFVYIALTLYRKSERFIQTISAILGANAIIQLIALPLFASSGHISTDLAETSSTILFALLLVGAWSFSVSVFVIKEALELRLAPAVLTTLACQAATLILLVLLFPELTAEVEATATNPAQASSA